MARQKQDFRQYLNLALELYYHSGATLVLHKAFDKQQIPYDAGILLSIADTLEKDGHVSYIHGYSPTPVGRITGQGRIFFEQGGYKDAESRLDKMIFWLKNHRIISVLLLIAIGLSSIYGFVKIFLEIVSSF